MTRPPELADRAALLRNRARARRAPVTFLHELAIAELQERLAEVNRSFTAPAVVTGAAETWAGAVPGARIVADAETLDLEEGAHDLIIHGLCMHWAGDPVGQLVQCRRALRPDGLFIGVMFGGRTLAELRVALAEAESRLSGGLSPRVLPFGELRDLGALLQRAGFALPVADSDTRTVTYPDLRSLMHDLRGMGEANALAARERRPAPRRMFDLAENLYHRHFARPDGRLPARFEMVWLTGWAPADSQPRPLRPGSASARLADALGARETPLSDRED